MGTSIRAVSHLIRVVVLEKNHRHHHRKPFSRILLIHPTVHRSPLFSSSNSNSSPPFFMFSMGNKTGTNVESGISATATNPSPPNPTKTVRVLIKGRVQGVFYRNWTVENARGLGLKGWVRNKRDGSVEALFSGEPDSVNEMEQRCRRGPPDALVTAFEVFPSNEDPGHGFDLKLTV